MNYYPIPTPPDIQFHERFPLRSVYNNKSIYEWNIDGISEHEILDIVQEMLMTSTTYSTNNDDHTIIQYLIAGFISQHRGWWENMLTDAHRQHIMTNINELGQQNVVHKLIYAITKHFIGDHRILQEISSKILQILRCRTLSDFRWYHDVLLSKVVTRPYANASYWKERFMFGIPRALTENVQNTLREKWQGIIPYDELTYEDLISEVKMKD